MSAVNRFYSSIKYSNRDEFLKSTNIKCIFISHQKEDKEHARRIAEYLQNAEVEVYFDEYDRELKISHQQDDPKKVTEAICNGINNSSHMIVIVSPNTVRSLWVPFEIGYGYGKTDLAVLCLKGFPKGSLPEYIRTVKIIRDIYDLNNIISSFSGQSKSLLGSQQYSNYNDNKNPLINVMDSLIYEK